MTTGYRYQISLGQSLEGDSFTGYTNAVSATLYFLKSAGIPVDEDSFKRLADLRGDAPAEAIKNGFIIYGYDELQRLCDIADMVIYHSEGLVRAAAPEEWIERNKPC